MKHRKRAAALIITAALALGLLAGCGAAKTPGKPGATPGTAAEGSGSVWRAEKRKIDGLEGNMDAKAAAGDKLYFSTAPGYDAEGENTDTVQLWSVPLEGGTAEKLSGYKAMATPEGLEGTRVQIGAIAPSSEGLCPRTTLAARTASMSTPRRSTSPASAWWTPPPARKSAASSWTRPWRRSRSSPRTWATRCSCPP